MAKTRTTSSQIFTTVKTQGGLFPPEFLQKICEQKSDVEGLSAESYHLVAGRKLNEAINNAWSPVKQNWEAFKARTASLDENDPAIGLTRDHWLLPLFQELGFGRLQRSAKLEIEGMEYPISHMWERVPIHLTGWNVDIDKRQSGVAGSARMAPYSMLQEFLNRSEGHLWGLVSNGRVLRLMRDNLAMTRQAYIEFDLEAMMAGEAYSDFGLLWLLCHESRFAAEGSAQCWLEKWCLAAEKEGVPLRQKLSKRVAMAISVIGSGFLSHPANRELQRMLREGELDKLDFYRQILRLVYRLIFLFVAEDRDLLHPSTTTAEVKKLYFEYYSTRRIRKLAERKRGSNHGDLWQQIQTLFTIMMSSSECPRLGIKPFGSFLWSSKATPALANARLANSYLLEAIRYLAVTQSDGVTRAVDYRNLGAEELGSIYESLLEMHPDVHLDSATVELLEVPGNERKLTGSYYTPPSLVRCLLDSALEPVIEDRLKRAKTAAEKEQALLGLKVCDPACGSGHFLIAAAHRIAKHLARVRTEETEPTPEAVRHALRDVIGHCLYGVDINPMSAELCRVSLWIEALEPGKPLSFLDHHIRVGNSLFGATPELVADGLPDAAFEPIGDDNPKACTLLRKRNSGEREGIGGLFVKEDAFNAETLRLAVSKLDELPDDTLDAVASKERAFEQNERSYDFLSRKRLFDTWCAAFVVPKKFQVGATEPTGITQRHMRDLSQGRGLPTETLSQVEQQSAACGFFHWHLAFPEVFEHGGFDVVLGNPPWERIKLQELEFFASESSEIAGAQNAAARKRLIEALPITNYTLWEKWFVASRAAQGESHFARNSGRYPLCGKGDINTYALFAEHNWRAVAPDGRAGFIVPSGIATDDTTKDYFQAITKSGALRSLWEFENVGFFTAGKGHMLRFALTTLSGKGDPESFADFMFQGQAVTDLQDPERHFTLSAQDIAIINPNTGTCPIFRTKRDASITLKIYRTAGVLVRECAPDGNPWGLKFLAMFHMTNDSGMFRTRGELVAAGWEQQGNRFANGGKLMLPLYEAKMVYTFNHRSGSYEDFKSGERPHRLPLPSEERLHDPKYLPQPCYWVEQTYVNEKLNDVWERDWLLGWRDVTDARASVRTVVACLVSRTALSNKIPLFLPSVKPSMCAAFYANLSSFVLDYAARQKIGGITLNFFIVKQLPVLPPTNFSAFTPWSPADKAIDWLLPRILELTYTAWDLKSFAEDCGDYGSPFVWDTERRFYLQCEIDAAFFHLYGIKKDDVDYILETFHVLKRSDMRNYDEYRTKRVIQEIYDAFAHAAATGIPYVSPLPPPRRAP